MEAQKVRNLKSKKYEMNEGLITAMIDNMVHMIRIVDSEHRVIYMNKSMKKTFKDGQNKLCYEVFGEKGPCEECIVEKSWEKNTPQTKEISAFGRNYRVLTSPVMLDDKSMYSMELFSDISDQKKLETELFKSYQRINEELKIARNIQKGIMPKNGIYGESVSLSSVCIPADHLGGDLFDLVKIGNDKTLIYIADVSGHGVQASMLTMYLREVIRGNRGEIEKGLKMLIEAIFRSFSELYLNEEIYFSLLLCLYDKKTKELTILNGGHNCLPIILRENGDVEEIDVKGMLITKLGEKLKYPYDEVKVKMGKDDRLILYTDGVLNEGKQLKSTYDKTSDLIELIYKNSKISNEELAEKIACINTIFQEEPALDDKAVVVAKFL